MFFKKKNIQHKTYDATNKKPAIRVSICTGEQAAGFKHLHDERFEEVILIRNSKDLEEFKERYGIKEEIEKFY